MTPTLTEAQVRQFHDEGWVALPAITTPSEIEWLRELYDRLFDARVGREEGNQFDLAGDDQDPDAAALPQILQLSKYAPELKDCQYWRHGLAVARQLLGPETRHQGEHAILKPASNGAATPWHQDEAYWNAALDYNSLSIWMPLQDADRDNGCLWFLPGSHRWEVKPHHCIGNDPRVHGLEIDHPEQLDTSSAVVCPVPAGGCSIHHCRTLHYAGPNHTPGRRRAYILGFGTPAAERPEPREFYWNTAKQTPREARAKVFREQQAAKES